MLGLGRPHKDVQGYSVFQTQRYQPRGSDRLGRKRRGQRSDRNHGRGKRKEKIETVRDLYVYSVELSAIDSVHRSLVVRTALPGLTVQVALCVHCQDSRRVAAVGATLESVKYTQSAGSIELEDNPVAAKATS